MRIGLTLRITNAQYYEESRDSLAYDWVMYLESLGHTPIFIPNGLMDYSSYLKSLNLDLIIFTGGDEIITSPEKKNIEHRRDIAEKEIYEFALNTKIPLLGVCRGMQVINFLNGGHTITLEDTYHVSSEHCLVFSDNELIKEGNNIEVNSYHDNVIPPGGLANNLTIIATDKDGNIEMAIDKSKKIILVMWHPEREMKNDNGAEFNKVIFKYLKDI